MKFEIEKLTPKSKAIHELAIARAKRFLKAEAELLTSIIEISKDRTFEKFGEGFITPYCVKYLKLSDDVAVNFLRVARKSIQVPELQKAVEQARISAPQARVIASVINQTNKDEWIAKAETLSKHALEKEVASASPKGANQERAKPVGPNRNLVTFELDDETFQLYQRAKEVEANRAGTLPSLAQLQRRLRETYLDKQDPIRKAQRSRDCSKAKYKHDTNARDRGECQAEKPDGTKCGSRLWVHQHHIHEKQYGGENEAANMTTLCATHHRMWHESASP